MLALVTTAFVFGLMGSAHCIGMCGPIILAIPNQEKSLAQSVIHQLIYHISRAGAYTVFGLIIGLIGHMISLAGFQQSLSIFAGVSLLIIAFTSRKLESLVQKFPLFRKFYGFVQQQLGAKLKNQKSGDMAFMGFLNGLLPCGFVYAGLAAALATGSVVNSMIFMFVFGLGTLPAMFTLGVSKSRISFSLRDKLRKASPIFAAVLGILFILRGLSLGIPFISPNMDGGGKMMHHSPPTEQMEMDSHDSTNHD